VKLLGQNSTKHRVAYREEERQGESEEGLDEGKAVPERRVEIIKSIPCKKEAPEKLRQEEIPERKDLEKGARKRDRAVQKESRRKGLFRQGDRSQGNQECRQRKRD